MRGCVLLGLSIIGGLTTESLRYMEFLLNEIGIYKEVLLANDSKLCTSACQHVLEREYDPVLPYLAKLILYVAIHSPPYTASAVPPQRRAMSDDFKARSPQTLNPNNIYGFYHHSNSISA